MENLIQDVLKIAPANKFDIDGATFTDKPLYRLPPPAEVERQPALMSFSTIGGMLNVLKKEASALLRDYGELYICVKSPTNIVVTTLFRDEEIKIDTERVLKYGERGNVYEVKAITPLIAFNNFLSADRAIIQLNAMFEQTEERDELLKFISSITKDDSQNIQDNGVSQTVVVKSGVATKEFKTPKAIWDLKPYRSFIEAGQAESKFLLRVQNDLSIGLFECDGGAWALGSKKNILEYIETALNDFEPEHQLRITVVI